MLLGRTPELAAIDAMLAASRLGHGAALVIRGEAGIGKTALLEYAASTAGSMAVRSARGVQFEADVPFAGLHELLLHDLASIEQLPAAQAAALRSSLGLGERIEADRLIVGAATLGLLAARAEAKPVLVLIDDANWLDRASSEALAFAARRLAADPIAMLVGIRQGEESPFLVAGLPELEVGGLDATSARELLEQAAGRRLDAALTESLYAATAGNPLALVELGREAEHFRVPLSDRPLPLTTSVERAYLRRGEGISTGGRNALLLLAAAGAYEPAVFARAAQKLGLAKADLDEAESAAGLVTLVHGGLEFVHPLARAAIYHAAAAADRRAAHRALADALREPAAGDRRAWHLAAAATGPDEHAARALETAGTAARQRSAYAAAAADYQEAARLSEDVRQGARRLAAGAHCAWLAGRAEQAVHMLEEALQLAHDEPVRSEIEGLLGHIWMRQGRVEAGHRMLVGAALRIRDRDRLTAVRLLADACITAFGFGHPERRLQAARTALDLIRPDDPPAARALAHVAYGTQAVLAASGTDGPAHMRESVPLFHAIPEERMEPPLLLAAGLAGLFLREAQEGRDLLERALQVARERAPTGALPVLLFFLGRHGATASEDWRLARALYEESARVAAETTQSIWEANALAGLAWLDAYEGREADCAAHATTALDLADRHDLGFVKAWALTALGQLDLGLGRAAAALGHLQQCESTLLASGISDPDLSPAPDIVDALVRLGRNQEARTVLVAYMPTAEAKGQPFALARSARAQALLAPDPEMTAAFESALDHHARGSDVFERARTQLFVGERLRRARRRVEARRQLRRALQTFDRLGAVPWADRALAELKASGETARVRDDSQRNTLTPQELQVALALAEGRTTREAAAKLYVSPKTIEYHLRNVYDKLEIRSREQLAGALGVSQD